MDGLAPRKIGRRQRLILRPRRDELDKGKQRISSDTVLTLQHPSISMAGAPTSPQSANVDTSLSTSTAGQQPRPNVPKRDCPGAYKTLTSEEATRVASLPTIVPAALHVQTP